MREKRAGGEEEQAVLDVVEEEEEESEEEKEGEVKGSRRDFLSTSTSFLPLLLPPRHPHLSWFPSSLKLVFMFPPS
jgi:hypothetical protein